METNETMTDGLLAQRRWWLIGVLAAIAMMVVLMFMSTSPASADLCINPDQTNDASDVGQTAVNLVERSEFDDRGFSDDGNPGGRDALWEGHKNGKAITNATECDGVA